METPITKQFIVAFVLILTALAFSMVGAVILALPLGLAGGVMLIMDMVKKMSK